MGTMDTVKLYGGARKLFRRWWRSCQGQVAGPQADPVRLQRQRGIGEYLRWGVRDMIAELRRCRGGGVGTGGRVSRERTRTREPKSWIVPPKYHRRLE